MIKLFRLDGEKIIIGEETYRATRWVTKALGAFFMLIGVGMALLVSPLLWAADFSSEPILYGALAGLCIFPLLGLFMMVGPNGKKKLIERWVVDPTLGLLLIEEIDEKGRDRNASTTVLALSRFKGFSIGERLVTSNQSNTFEGGGPRTTVFWDIRLEPKEGGFWCLASTTNRKKADDLLYELSHRVDFRKDPASQEQFHSPDSFGLRKSSSGLNIEWKLPTWHFGNWMWGLIALACFFAFLPVTLFASFDQVPGGAIGPWVVTVFLGLFPPMLFGKSLLSIGKKGHVELRANELRSYGPWSLFRSRTKTIPVAEIYATPVNFPAESIGNLYILREEELEALSMLWARDRSVLSWDVIMKMRGVICLNTGVMSFGDLIHLKQLVDVEIARGSKKHVRQDTGIYCDRTV